MLTRNILGLAPNVVFYDLPAIPPAILNIPVFVSSLQAAYILMQAGMKQIPGPWILVNAWALFNRRSDLQGSGAFGDNGGHPFHTIVQGLTAQGVDLVFVAGNCGQICPDDRCGPLDIGPGRSISGANAYDEVLTVGAVRVNGLRIGNSSQGPGLIAPQKPDLVCPSNFAEITNEGLISSGTSASCGLAAGVVAALRTPAAWSGGKVPPTPAAMIAALQHGAGAVWHRERGYGLLNAGKTRGTLGI